MFALHLLSFSLVFSAFFLAFFAAVDRLAFILSTASLLTLICQDESGAKLSAYILGNTLVDIESSDLEYLGGDYDVTDIPDSTCIFDALAMWSSFEAAESATEDRPQTPAIAVVPVKAIGPEDAHLIRAWNAYRQYAAFAADFSPVIRPEAQYVASDDGEKGRGNASDSGVDDWYAVWSGTTG